MLITIYNYDLQAFSIISWTILETEGYRSLYLWKIMETYGFTIPSLQALTNNH